MLNRRSLFKLGGVLVAGLAATSANIPLAFAQPSKIEDLVQRYLSTSVQLESIQAWNNEYASLSAEELIRFNYALAQAVIKLATPFEPGVKARAEEARLLRNTMVQISVSDYGKPFNQLEVSKLFEVADKAQAQLKTQGNSPALKAIGKTGLMKPTNQGWPCFNYTRNASLTIATSLPNCVGYLQAAGAPKCGDPDLELRYSGYKTSMVNTNANGATYISALWASGRLQVLRDFSGMTDALIGGGSLVGLGIFALLVCE